MLRFAFRSYHPTCPGAVFGKKGVWPMQGALLSDFLSCTLSLPPSLQFCFMEVFPLQTVLQTGSRVAMTQALHVVSTSTEALDRRRLDHL